ncbi:MAG: hypothetical protein WB723_21610 [Candidatus Acidiferrales bacterium]
MMMTRSQQHGILGALTEGLLAALALLCLFSPFPAAAQKADAQWDLLNKTQTRVEQFVEQFAYLRYQEDILQEKLRTNDRPEYKQETVYDALLMTRFEDGRLRVEEQRLIERAPDKHELRPLIKTDGFSTLAMVFHPYYQSSFRFKKFDDQAIDGQILARIGFEHIPGKPTPILYQMIYSDRPMEISGVAWVDPNGNIHRIEMNVGSSMSDMGLKSVRAQLDYGLVTLKDEPEPQWLPVSATIDLETPKQHWRNVHRFVNYKKYRTEIKLDVDVFPSK